METRPGYKIQVLAYIDKFDPESDDDQDAVKDMTAQLVRGYWLDVMVQMVGPHQTVPISHIGDGTAYQTFEEAEEAVFQEVGIRVNRLTEPTVRMRWSCAAYWVGEFDLTGKPEEQVISESGLPPRNPDRSRQP